MSKILRPLQYGTMKKYLILFLAPFVFACETPKDEASQISVTPLEQGVSTERPEKVSTLGEACGIEDAICGVGLECKQNSQTSAEGICVETVVDKTLKCSKEQKPVCAQKGRNKNGYLNECEARRRGAEVLHEGLCDRDPNVVNNCEVEALSIGNCNTFFQGAFKNQETEKCEDIAFYGCGAEMPFNSLRDCQRSCEGKVYTKLRLCPEEKIINQMPTIGVDKSDVSREYFIYKGERREVAEFDMNWVNQNCEVVETVVF